MSVGARRRSSRSFTLGEDQRWRRPERGGATARRKVRSAMVTNLATRLLQAFAVLVTVSLLIYFLLDLLPGDAAEQLVGPAYDLTTEERAQRVQQERERLGLDRPLIVRYLEWLGGMVTGDIGRTVRGAPIAPLVGDRLAVSLEIALASVIIALLVSVGLA